MSPVFILSRLCLNRRFQFLGISVEPPVSAFTTVLTRSSSITVRRPTCSALSTGTFTVMSLCRIWMVRYSRVCPKTSRFSFLTTMPAPWCGYTTLSPTSNKPGLPLVKPLFSEDAGGLERPPACSNQSSRNPWKTLLFRRLRRFAGVFLLRSVETGAERRQQAFGLLDSELSAGRGAARRDREGDAELGALVEPALGLSSGPQPAREADLAEDGDVPAHRRVPGRRCDREGDREIGARLVDAQAAGDVDEHIGGPERDACVARQDGDDHREAFRIDAGGDAARHREVGRSDERLDLEQDRARAFEHARDGCAALARHRSPEELRRVRHADESLAGHLEDADLVRRAEAVLDRSQDAVGVVAVA